MSELDAMDDMSCDEFAEVAAELALGVLTGRERAMAIAHLDGCDACREHVRQLMDFTGLTSRAGLMQEASEFVRKPVSVNNLHERLFPPKIISN